MLEASIIFLLFSRTLNPLSVRTLLDYNEENLRVHFKDAWQLQKETETKQALNHFRDRINEIDSISDFNEKWLEIVRGVLAGNVFDWGSAVVANILDEAPAFGLSQAMDTIETRPWFIDDVDLWVKRLNVSNVSVFFKYFEPNVVVIVVDTHV